MHTPKTQHTGNTASSLEWIRSNCASEQPGEMFCTQVNQSSSHCTPSTHIDGLNGAKLLQETSHILLSCPFVQLSYPERGTANYNQELAQVGRAITDRAPYRTDNQHLSHAEPREFTRKSAQSIPPKAADYCSNIEYSSRLFT